jgi:hypothetical protein
LRTLWALAYNMARRMGGLFRVRINLIAGGCRRMSTDPKPKHTYSRRDILKGAPVALAGVLALSAMGRRLLRRKRSAPDFPEDSIFRPAKDPRDQA